jgi:hypothetical protein
LSVVIGLTFSPPLCGVPHDGGNVL